MAFTSAAARADLIRQHALGTEEDRERIELFAGPDFSFAHVPAQDLAVLADPQPRLTVNESANAAINQMAAEEMPGDMQAEKRFKKKKKKKEARAKAKESAPSKGQMALQGLAAAADAFTSGTVIGSEFSRIRK
jgi:hypothetical protein